MKNLPIIFAACNLFFFMHCTGTKPTEQNTNTGTLFLTSEPSKAVIVIGSDTIGLADSSGLKLKAETTRICFYKDSCDTCMDINALKGQDSALHVKLSCPVAPTSDSGTIFISSIPPVATVTMDGDTIGMTNVTKLRVLAGTHTMCFIKESCDSCFAMTFIAGDNPAKHVAFSCVNNSTPPSTMQVLWNLERMRWITYEDTNNDGTPERNDIKIDTASRGNIIYDISNTQIIQHWYDSSWKKSCYYSDTMEYLLSADTIISQYYEKWSKTTRRGLETAYSTMKQFADTLIIMNTRIQNFAASVKYTEMHYHLIKDKISFPPSHWPSCGEAEMPIDQAFINLDTLNGLAIANLLYLYKDSKYLASSDLYTGSMGWERGTWELSAGSAISLLRGSCYNMSPFSGCFSSNTQTILSFNSNACLVSSASKIFCPFPD